MIIEYVVPLFGVSLSAAGRLLFCLIKKVVKKIKLAVTQANERLDWVGLKLAFAGKRSNSKPTVETPHVHLRYSDEWTSFVLNVVMGCIFDVVL